MVGRSFSIGRPNQARKGAPTRTFTVLARETRNCLPGNFLQVRFYVVLLRKAEAALHAQFLRLCADNSKELEGDVLAAAKLLK